MLLSMRPWVLSLDAGCEVNCFLNSLAGWCSWERHARLLLSFAESVGNIWRISHMQLVRMFLLATLIHFNLMVHSLVCAMVGLMSSIGALNPFQLALGKFTKVSCLITCHKLCDLLLKYFLRLRCYILLWYTSQWNPYSYFSYYKVIVGVDVSNPIRSHMSSISLTTSLAHCQVTFWSLYVGNNSSWWLSLYCKVGEPTTIDLGLTMSTVHSNNTLVDAFYNNSIQESVDKPLSFECIASGPPAGYSRRLGYTMENKSYSQLISTCLYKHDWQRNHLQD